MCYSQYIMNRLLLNIIIFIIGSFYGWCQEILMGYLTNNQSLINRNWCGGISTGNNCVSLLPIYGFGLVLILNAFLLLRHKLNKFWIILIIWLSIIIMECIAAILVYKLWGRKAWDYGTKVCEGGIALKPSILWVILITIVVFVMDKY